MNFVGYVPLRRGLLSHIQEGRLTNHEALTFVVLLMLADKETGSGTINSPTLRSFMPGLSHDAAKRALLGLEDKKYVFRQIIPFSKRVYPFWINLYVPTTGPNKSRQINLSQVFESGDINDIRYVELAPDGAPQGAPQTPPQGAHHYKKDKEKDKENTPTSNGVCASVSETVSHTMSDSSQRVAKHTYGSACAPHCDPQTMHHDMQQTMHHPVHHDMHHENTPEAVPFTWWGLDLPGHEFHSGDDAGYWNQTTGRRISFEEARQIAAQKGKKDKAI